MVLGRLGNVAFCGLVVIMLPGCLANANSIYREFSLSSDSAKTTSSISVDAKQRVILSGQRNGNLIVCAEPSPDALSVIGSSLAAKGYTPSQITVELAASMSENATNIGLRTQTIQLLRDAMYRLCEGYLGGALAGDGYERLQRKYQNVMLGLLAIEQLTGAVTPRQVVLKTTSMAESSNGLMNAQRNVDELKMTVQRASDRLEKVKKQQEVLKDDIKVKQHAAKKDSDAATASTADDAAKAKAKESAVELLEAEATDKKLADTLKDLEAAHKEAEENLQTAQELRDIARTRTSGNGQFDPLPNGTSNVNKDTVSALGKSVENIVGQIVKLSYSEESCLQHQLSLRDGDGPNASLSSRLDESVIEFCEKLLKLRGQEVDKSSAIIKSSLPVKAQSAELQRQEEELQKLENELKLQYLRQDLDRFKRGPTSK